MRRNLELKARYPNPAIGRARALELGAVLSGVEVQIDSYFRVARGRLKLREIEGQGAFLIYYERPDRDRARLSNYHLMPVASAGEMRAALGAALGLRGQVQKRREIFLWHNVRIHFDEVLGLGRFIEFEAVLAPTNDEITAQGRLDQLCVELGVDSSQQLGCSYADLLGF